MPLVGFAKDQKILHRQQPLHSFPTQSPSYTHSGIAVTSYWDLLWVQLHCKTIKFQSHILLLFHL